MEKNLNPAVTYYYINEEEEKIQKQIAELNKSLKILNVLRARVGEKRVEVDELIKNNLLQQYELDDIYRKTAQKAVEEEIMEWYQWENLKIE